jgi:hypothetical protein
MLIKVVFNFLILLVVTLANVSLKPSWLLHLTYINKGLDAPTLHMPHTSSVSAYHQSLHLILRPGPHHSFPFYALIR